MLLLRLLQQAPFVKLFYFDIKFKVKKKYVLESRFWIINWVCPTQKFYTPCRCILIIKEDELNTMNMYKGFLLSFFVRIYKKQNNKSLG